MTPGLMEIESFIQVLSFVLAGAITALAFIPFITNFLYKYQITAGRRGGYDLTLALESRRKKSDTPTMGGVLIIAVIAVITVLFNWERSFTWVPVGVMLLASFLGLSDDLLSIFGKKRRSRTLKQTLVLIRVHRDLKIRIWLVLTLPWTIFKRASVWLSSHPGKGVYVHEKLLLQFASGAIAVWWIYFKLAEQWRLIYLPFDGFVNFGWLLIPLIILVVMFTINAVNFTDGLDGLTSGMLIPTFGALMFISWVYGFNEMAILNGTAVGALLTYTYFNVKPARLQMGDVGSFGLGALLAINALVINQMVSLFFLAFMFYVEALSVIVQVGGKYLLGRRVFKMVPLHHHFELRDWSENKIVTRFWLIHLAFVFLGIWVALH